MHIKHKPSISKQELQLHLGVLQQHAALIGGPNATSCPVCHKLFLGADALMEHMKHAHKEPNPPNPSSEYLINFWLFYEYMSRVTYT